MKKQICSSFLIILIVVGVVMSILNFTTKAYADQNTIWGTKFRVTSILLQSIYYNQGRHLFKDYYCIDDPSDYVIVFAN